MERAKAEGWTPERLAGDMTPELERQLDCEPETAVEVAQYLADEFFQLGDAVLICDRTTGKAIARITDADMYQPPMQRREGSRTLAKPLPRLNPNLEGFLVSYIFEEARDRELISAIRARHPQTAFLAEAGDPSLNALTRAGRVNLANRVREGLPDVLEGVQGSARAFLDRFNLIVEGEGEPGRQMEPLPRRTAQARGSQNVVDPKAMNLRFSWEATLRARTGTGWVREMASHLVNEARTHVRAHHRIVVPHPLLTPEHIQLANWTGDPATCVAIQRAFPDGPAPRPFPCSPEEAGAVGFSGDTPGTIIIHPGTYTFETREGHGRWDMNATMDYTMYVNWEHLRFLHVTDIPIEAVAEIV